MSFMTVATSIQDSLPIELYKFTRGVDYWYFASCIQDITYETNLYEATFIKRSRIMQTENMDKNVVEITLSRSSEFGMYFIRYPSNQITYVNIIRSFQSTGDYANWWKGRVIGARISGNEIILECEAIYTSLKRPGLRKLYELTCCHTLYETDCKVSRQLYARTVEITNIKGRVITVSNMTGVAAGWFSGGMIESMSLNRYYISIHNGDRFTIFLNSELKVGNVLTIYPGCNQLMQTCIDKFDNILNFGGFPWIPDVNPYDGIEMI